MTDLTVERLGYVLIVMASKALDRAEQCDRSRNMTGNAGTLLHHLSIVLQHGAEECIKICEDNYTS